MAQALELSILFEHCMKQKHEWQARKCSYCRNAVWSRSMNGRRWNALTVGTLYGAEA